MKGLGAVVKKQRQAGKPLLKVVQPAAPSVGAAAAVASYAGGLQGVLLPQMQGERPGRALERLHASEVTRADPEFCPRERWYQLRDGDVPKPEYVNPGQHLTWHLGWELQEYVTQAARRAGVAFGKWVCRRCGFPTTPMQAPATCPGCKAAGEHLRYAEPVFKSPFTLISGSVDLLVTTTEVGIPDTWLRVVEIKTMLKEEFAKLKMPLAEHRVRTSLYLRTIAESNHQLRPYIDTSCATILYVCKGGYRKAPPQVKDLGFSWTPFHEFTIKRDDTLAEPYATKGKQLRHGLENDAVPARICETPACPRAKGCTKVHACWADKP